MNVHISYKGNKTPDTEKEIIQHVEKLRKRLQVFRPELIHLHANLDQNSPREGMTVSLNLRLPSGQMTAQSKGANSTAALKVAFDGLKEQLTKHKDLLRNHRNWPRRRRESTARSQSKVPFEETIAAVQPPVVSESDISSYVNANLQRLVRFVDRELRYRENTGLLRSDQVTREEVIDEAIANALGDGIEKPERLALEPWLYRLSMRAIDELTIRSFEDPNSVPLEQSTRKQNVGASDEPQLQYHQPDETMSQQERIPDRGVATPEQIAASDEMITLVETALLGSKPEAREAFLLYAVEGFTAEEIAVISDRSVEQVRKLVTAAREHLRKALPMPDEFKNKLLQHSKIA